MTGFPLDNAYITAENNLAVSDEQAIRQVIARLNHSLDAANYPLYASFFSQDAVFNTAFGRVTGPNQIAATLEKSRPYITNKRHSAVNLLISGSGDEAVVTSYLIVFERTASLAYVGSAINVDTMRRQDNKWIVIRHDSELDPATLAAMQVAMKVEQKS
jgi:ketosteroid isomerase-like protein